MVQIEFSKLGEFLIELQRSQEEATKSMETVQEAIKKTIQQGEKKFSKVKDWGQHVAGQQKYPLKQTLEEAGPEKIWTFQNLEGYWSRSTQLKLLKGWIIHNVFNEDLLIRCRELQLKEQHMELAPPLMIINEEEKYEVEEVRKHRKQEQRT